MKHWLLALPLLAACATAPAPIEPLPDGRRVDLDFAWPPGARLAVETTRTARIIGERGPSRRTLVVRRTVEVTATEDGLELRSRDWSVEPPEEGWIRQTLELALEELAVPDLRLARDGTLIGTTPGDDGGAALARRLVASLAPSLKEAEGQALVETHFSDAARTYLARASWKRWIDAWRGLPFTGGRPIRATETMLLDGPPTILDTEVTFAGYGPCGADGGRCVVLDRRAWLPPDRTEVIAARLATAHPGAGQPVGIELERTARLVADPATLLPAALDWTETMKVDFDTGDALLTNHIDSFDERRIRFRRLAGDR